MKTDILMVGVGFAGSVVVERLAHAGRTVRVIDRRPLALEARAWWRTPRLRSPSGPRSHTRKR